MANPTTDLLEIILRECAGARPQPWYPSDYARATGVPRDGLDEPLDQLRLGGLIRLTDWVQGKGQGYALTLPGEKVLEKPRLLERLRAGEVPRANVPPPPHVQMEERAPGWERARAVRDALLDRSRPVATLGILAANVLLFVVGAGMAQQRGVLNDYLFSMLGRQPGAAAQQQLTEIWHQLGSLHRPDLVADGEWWRLLTTAFLHMGVLHIALNMYFLFVVGPLVERMFGPARFLLLYGSAALTSSCAAMIFSPNTIPIGASGALCGLLGAMAAWVYLNRPYLPREFSAGLMRAVITNVVLIVFISLIPGVSAAGHFGGGVGGLIAAVPLTYSRFGVTAVQRGLGLLGALLVPVIAFAWMNYGLAEPTAQARAQPLLAKAEKIGWEVYKKDVGPLCLKVQNGHNVTSADVKAAVAEADRAREQVQEIAGELPDPESYHDARIKSALEAGREYVAAWLRLFDQFHTACPDGKVPSADNARAIIALTQPINRYAKQLQESVLFSAH